MAVPGVVYAEAVPLRISRVILQPDGLPFSGADLFWRVQAFPGDSVFYGEIFTASYPGHVAHIVPIGEGYSSWLHGKVVDMLYFPIIETTLPSWVPFWGGTEVLFFRFIFNLADASISVGVALLLLFYRRTLSHSLQTESEKMKSIETNINN